MMDTDFDQQIGGFDDLAVVIYPAIRTLLRQKSSVSDGVALPGVRVGVMSFGPNPGDAESFLMSW